MYCLSMIIHLKKVSKIQSQSLMVATQYISSSSIPHSNLNKQLHDTDGGPTQQDVKLFWHIYIDNKNKTFVSIFPHFFLKSQVIFILGVISYLRPNESELTDINVGIWVDLNGSLGP